MNCSLKVISVFVLMFLFIGIAGAASSGYVSPSQARTINSTLPLIVNTTLGSNISEPLVQLNLPLNVTIGPLAYVVGSSSEGYGINVIDTNSYDYNTISLGEGVSAASIALSPDGSVLYATASTMRTEYSNYIHSGWLFKLNSTTGKIIDKISLGDGINPRYVAVGPDGRVYISWSIFGDSTRSGMTIFDFKNVKKYEWYWKDYFAFSNTPLSSTFNADGSIAYFGATDNYPDAYVIDWGANKVYKQYFSYPEDGIIRSISLDPTTGALCAAMWNVQSVTCIVYSSYSGVLSEGYYAQEVKFYDGKTYVLGYDNETYLGKLHIYTGLNVMPLFTMYSTHSEVSLTFTKGKIPSHMAITPDGKYAYITPENPAGGEGVAVVDLQSLTQVATVPVTTDKFSPIVIAPEKTLWSSSKKFDDYDFTLSSGIDLVAWPYVVYSTPEGNGTSIYSTISVKFSDEMNPSTINSGSFSVLNSRNYVVSGIIEYGNGIAMFTPSSNLLENATYTVKLTNAIKDMEGNALTSNYTWKFKTGMKPVMANITIVSSGFERRFYLNITTNNTQNNSVQTNNTQNNSVQNNNSQNNSSQNNSAQGSGMQIGQPLGGGLGIVVQQNESIINDSNYGTVCTMEAKQCSDGSYVSRNSNKNCEFDACPSVGNVTLPLQEQNTTSEPTVQQPASEDFFSGIIRFLKSLFGMK